MGKERTIGKITAGAAGIVGNGEDEENGIWTDAKEKWTAITRYIKSKRYEK